MPCSRGSPHEYQILPSQSTPTKEWESMKTRGEPKHQREGGRRGEGESGGKHEDKSEVEGGDESLRARIQSGLDVFL